jgi:MoaA/NifB/PqqE/SkfB family radical SAM enzyme
MPFSTTVSAPYRMDLAITYRCNNDCAHCYNARARSHPELSTQDWKNILDRVWDARIPHVVFTGGEPTLRNDLPELIAYADSLGMVTGLNTNGTQLGNQAFLDQLVSAGLDHVQITLESHEASIHDTMVRRNGAWHARGNQKCGQKQALYDDQHHSPDQQRPCPGSHARLSGC